MYQGLYRGYIQVDKGLYHGIEGCMIWPCGESRGKAFESHAVTWLILE